MCAAFIACLYSADSRAAPFGTATFASPPWQSVQPSFTASEACAASIPSWQPRQERLFAVACSFVCSISAVAGSTCVSLVDEVTTAGRQRSARNAIAQIAARGRLDAMLPIIWVMARAPRSELQSQVREEVPVEAVVFVDVFPSRAGHERGRAAEHRHVVRVEGAVAHPEIHVVAHLPVDVALEDQPFDHLGRRETDVVRREQSLEPRRDVEVDADARDLHAGIHVLRLPLVLAALQVGEEAPALCEAEPGPREADAHAIPEAESAAHRVRIREDRVEAFRVAVEDVVVTRREEDRGARPYPVVVARDFHEA